MSSKIIGTGDDNTLVFDTGVPYVNARFYADGLWLNPTLYTYAGTVLTFLPAAFPASPTPGAPPRDTVVAVDGDTASVSTSSVTASRNYTATELIASVQQRAFIALNPRDFGTSQILRLFNEEIDGYLVPFVAQRRLEFWVESQDVNVVAGVATIPSVAMGGKLRALAYLVAGTVYGLDQTDLPVAIGTPMVPLTTQYPSKYYFMGANVILWPTPSLAGQLRIYYYRRPSVLVLPSQCVQVTGFPGGAPAGFYRIGFSGNLPSAYGVNVSCDVVSGVPNFTLLQASAAIHATDGATYIELPGSQPSGLAVGDWLCLAGTAPVVVGAPADLLNVLCQEVALKIAEAKGTNETIARVAAGLARAEASAGWTIQQRNDGAMRKLSAFPVETAAWPVLWGGG
jgi:hypothetical protein